MISRELALELREAGLAWHPESGDRFVLDLPEGVDTELDADVFTVSEMTIDTHPSASGTILGFNGTTEWALDSVSLGDAVWLPGEEQLREMLGAAFHALRRTIDAFEVEIELDGGLRPFEHPEPAEAYGLALLALIRALR